MQVCIKTGETGGKWEGDYTIVRASHDEDGKRLVWSAPTEELDSAKARGKAGERDPRYSEASSVSLGGVRLLTDDRERAAQTHTSPSVREPEPIKENA